MHLYDRIRRAAVAALTSLVALISVAAAATPAGVSPGAVDRIATIRDDCPTFSWQVVAGTAFYELVVYRLEDNMGLEAGEAIDLAQAEEVLYTRVPGGASSWTPELELGLAAGGRYVWFVRAVFDQAEGEVVDASEWSQGRFFSVAPGPSPDELREALQVVRRYLEAEGGPAELGALLSGTTAPESVGPARHSAAATKTMMHPLAGTAAIKGEMVDLVGETYGVWGLTHSSTDGSRGVIGHADATSGQVYGVGGVSDSPEGAGVAAFNSADGADLELMSAASASALLSERGIDRPWPTPQTFTVTNSTGAGMTLEVDGVEVVTTATDQDSLAGLSCTADEVTKWDGSDWQCASDEDTAPRAAGNQLGLNGNTLDVVEGSGSGLDADTVDGHDSLFFASAAHLHDGRYYTETELNTAGGGGDVHWGNLSGVPAGFADGVDDDTTYSFGPGLTVSDGQIVVDPAAFTIQVSVVDSGGDVGQHSSLAIGTDGLALISYYDITNGDLNVAHCTDLPCTTGSRTKLDTIGDVGQYTSLVIGADGLGLISYYDVDNGDLKVAHCHDVACASATVTTLDSSGDVGQHTSVTIGGDGLGLISYTEAGPGDLKVAHCMNAACTSATITTLDTSSCEFSSVAIGGDGLGLIAYHDPGDGELKVAHCGDPACTSATISRVDTSPVTSRPIGLYPSLAIGIDGFGIVSYYNRGSLNVAHCTDAACTAPLAEIVNLDSVSLSSTSLAIGGDGRARIVYLGADGEIKTARCVDTSCSGATLNSVLKSADSVAPRSLAIGPDSRGLVSCYEADFLGGDLKVALLPIGL